MRIRVNPDAVSRQRARIVCGESPWSPEFEAMMRAVEGEWLDVETDHLFRDQFNTTPIPEVSENGLRIMARDVIEIEGDVRGGVWKCGYCYGYSRDGDGACEKCGRSGYLDELLPGE